MTKATNPMLKKDLEAVLDYCQDDREWDDFKEHIIENGTPGLKDKDVEELANADDDRSQEIMEKAAGNLRQTHIWGCAFRARKELLGE